MRPFRLFAAAAVLLPPQPAPPAAARAGDDARSRARPTQRIEAAAGPARVTGVFAEEGGRCDPQLFAALGGEPGEPGEPGGAPPPRVRVRLEPAQSALVETSDGGRLALTCGAGASNLLLRSGL